MEFVLVETLLSYSVSQIGTYRSLSSDQKSRPSPFFLMIWRKNPEALRQQGFELCQESEGDYCV